MSRFRLGMSVTVAAMFAGAGGQADPSPPRPKLAVAELFEDDADSLIRNLTNQHSFPGEARVEAVDVFSGRRSIKIIPIQRQSPAVPGWAFRIVERPGPNEFRYLRFAWKADGCAGIMLQLHDDQYYNIRYTAGVDRYNWGTKFVADRPPAEWTVVTRDLFADFGAVAVRGMSLTAFDGRAAYFDHIYLGRTVDDLDRIDATGAGGGPRSRLAAGDLAKLWEDMAGTSAPRAYAAFWRMVAAADQSVPFLAEKLTKSRTGPDAETVRKWVRELEDDAFRVREAATAKLTAHVEAVAADLETLTRTATSPEVRARATRILALRNGRPTEHERCERAVRVLEYAGGPYAVRALEVLARNGQNGTAGLAEAALKRLADARR
jgi:hypothetical protein